MCMQALPKGWNTVNFITRTTPSSSALLETSEAIITESIIPARTSRSGPLPIERELFSLPLKSRGLGIDCPENHHDDYGLSKKLSEPLESKILWLQNSGRSAPSMIYWTRRKNYQTLKVSWARSRNMHSKEHRKKEHRPGWMFSRWSDTDLN